MNRGRKQLPIWQRIVSRKLIGFLPNPKNVKHILCYARELLECGHEKDVYDDGAESFTARHRSCHKCAAGVPIPQAHAPRPSFTPELPMPGVSKESATAGAV